MRILETTVAGAHTVRAEVLDNLAEFERWSSDWHRLYGEGSKSSPYQEWEWNRALVQHHLYKGRVLLITVVRHGTTRAILPLSMSRAPLGYWLLTILGFDTWSDYLDVVGGNDVNMDDITALLEGLFKLFPHAVFLATQIPEWSELVESLGRSSYKRLAGLAACYAIRIPQNAAAYVSSLRHSTRRHDRRIGNRARAAFGEDLRFELGCQPYLDRELAEALIAVYSHRQLQKFGGDISDKRKRFLLDVLTSRHDPNSIFYSTLTLHGQIVAENVGFFSPATRTVTVPLLAYNASYANYRLGNHLLSLSVQALADARTGWKPDLYDLTRGSEEYKLRYGGNLSLNHRFILTARPLVYRQYMMWDAILETMRSTWSSLRSVRRVVCGVMRPRVYGPK